MTMPVEAERIVHDLPTVSAKIRALNAAGYSRADIARMLGKRYQHVRNVLEAAVPAPSRSEGTGGTIGMSEEPVKFSPPPISQATRDDRFDLRLGPDGEVVLPAAIRAALEVGEGDRLMARVVDGELRMFTPKVGIRKAQEMMRQFSTPGRSLVAELTAQRRDAAKPQAADG